MTRRAATPTSRPAPRRGPPLAAALERIAERHGALLLALMMAAYSAIHIAICAIKLRYHLYTDFDLAIFAQATDGILRGDLHSSIRGLHVLGDHTSLNLFLIAPLYALFRTPMTLLVVQTLALAAGAIAASRLARRELGSAAAGLAFAAVWLLHPAIGYTNLYEFHPEVLSTAPLLFAFEAMRAGRLGRTVLFATLALLGKEDVPLVVATLAVLAAWTHRPRALAWGGALGALAIGFALLSFAVLKPLYGAEAADYGRLYLQWGETPREIALAMLREPWRVATALVHTPGYPFDTTIKLQYWIHMLLPVGFLAVLSPFTLAVALPIVVEHFVSWRPPQHTILYHYTALVTPFVFAAAIVGARRLVARAPGRAPAVAAGALAAAVLSNLLFGPVVGSGALQLVRSEEPNAPSGLDRALTPYREAMLARLDRSGTVVASYQFLNDLVGARDPRSIHNVMMGLHTFSSAPYPMPTGVSAALVDFAHFRVRPYADSLTGARLRAFLAANALRPVEAAGDVVRFARGPGDTLDLVRFGVPAPEGGRRVRYAGGLELLGHALEANEVAAGGILPLATHWVRTGPLDSLVVLELLALEPFGRPAFRHMRHLGYMIHPAHDWPVGVPVRERVGLIVPVDVPPGIYELGLRAGLRTESGQRLMAADDPALEAKSMIVELGRFTVARR